MNNNELFKLFFGKRFRKYVSYDRDKIFFSFLFKEVLNKEPIESIMYIYDKLAVFKTYGKDSFRLTDGKKIPSVYISYIFEWLVFLKYSLVENHNNNTFNIKNINFSDFYEKGLLGTLTKPFKEELKTFAKNSAAAKNVYDKLYFGYYHQEEVNNHTFSRCNLLMKTLEDNEYLTEVNNHDIKKYIILLVSFMHLIKESNSPFISKNHLINFLEGTKITRDDLSLFLQNIGLTSFSDYKNKVSENDIEHYFGGNLIGNNLVLNHNPIIELENNTLYVDQYYLIRNFYKIFFQGNLLKKGKKLNFGVLLEDYIIHFIDYQFLLKRSKLNKEDYIIKSSLLKKSGDIDLVIFNKTTGNLLICEIKSSISISEKGINAKSLDDFLTEGQPLYKGIEQLHNHSNKKNKDIEYALGVDEGSIKHKKYLFINHENSFCWNLMIPFFLRNKYPNFKLPIQYLSTIDFEKLISISCITGKDFYDIVDEKNQNCNCNGLPILNDCMSTPQVDNPIFTHPKSSRQSFSIFFYSEYKISDPVFIPDTTFLKNFFNK